MACSFSLSTRTKELLLEIRKQRRKKKKKKGRRGEGRSKRKNIPRLSTVFFPFIQPALALFLFHLYSVYIFFRPTLFSLVDRTVFLRRLVLSMSERDNVLMQDRDRGSEDLAQSPRIGSMVLAEVNEGEKACACIDGAIFCSE
jgi:hypothetical protein